jgi:hypothetical protein
MKHIKLTIGDELPYKWFDGGGFTIKMYSETSFKLFETPLYGGNEEYIDEFTSLELAKQHADTLN